MALIQAVAVIGAGIPGRAIACSAALGGYRTILEDILPASLRKAEAELHASLDQAVRARLEYASTVEEAARQADLVIEAVPDELESKLEIFTLLDKICKPHTILALTSSTLTVNEVASITYRPQKCIGMRFSTPARLEVVSGSATDEATISACLEVGRRMSREAVLIDETKPRVR